MKKDGYTMHHGECKDKADGGYSLQDKTWTRKYEGVTVTAWTKPMPYHPHTESTSSVFVIWYLKTKK